MQLKGKVVVVSGAASGIGASVVKLAAKQGADAIGLDIDDSRGRAVVEQSGGTYQHCDVSNTDSWATLAAWLKTSHSGIDYLHLNAGIQSAPPEAPLADYRFGSMQIARYQKMMGVNVDGVVLGLHHLLPLMRPGGSIVVTGSLAGVVPYEIDPLYSMSKHAITGLVRSLKSELGEQGLRINAICPGAIDTGIIPNDQRGGDAQFMTPDHVADEVMHLFLTAESGETWLKIKESKPVYIMYPRGRKKD
ncbi:MAG: SDR family oxidoreductase [Pseudomonadales bacterium]|jgi:NAD(P)-dependent dehydrogenase (short-subunit alcohol dehydrogenase family)|tara:strand:+ start:18580 stop:19323 length:744 start_codon:yes stop_codon:yes gene_type:complete